MMPKNLADAWRLCLLLSLLLAGAAGCRQNSADQPPNPLPPTATSVATAATATPSALAEHFVTVATSAPYPPFVYFDEFGSVVGFDADVLDALMQQTGHEYEFVVTNFDGLLDSVANGEFDMAVSPLITPEPRPGLAYTTPYL
ncbi:MAG: transporter substrate-binding domain-containing protein, partial [Anaerolineales bacterium]|nr:transporter substrate-binding domain-containing protein [Anaerolineales bacterium]